MAERTPGRFHHVHIICSNVAATERWLVEGMGAEVRQRERLRGTPFVSLKLGGATIVLSEPLPPHPSVSPEPAIPGTDQLALQVEDIDATVAELKSRGVKFSLEPVDFDGGYRIAFVEGPDNIRIELIGSSRTTAQDAEERFFASQQ